MFRVQQAAIAEQVINKSRFIATVDYSQDERQAALALRKLAASHPSAHHLAYAFRIKTAEGIVQRFHDAGEPSGTAGKPILQMIEGMDLINVCIGVIRYYGGINLGTGGLVRAYGGTAKLALNAAHILPFVEMKTIRLELAYQRLDYFLRELSKVQGELVEKNFTDKVHVVASLPITSADTLLQQFSDPYFGKKT